MIQGKTKTLEPFEDGLRVTTKNSLTANDAAKRAEANVAAYKTRQTCSVFEFLNNHNIPTHYIKKLDDRRIPTTRHQRISYAKGRTRLTSQSP